MEQGSKQCANMVFCFRVAHGSGELSIGMGGLNACPIQHVLCSSLLCAQKRQLRCTIQISHHGMDMCKDRIVFTHDYSLAKGKAEWCD